MSKRVFELAKELNTTSKRLIEKLGEINIIVKSHMSLLEEDELDRLYKHIGVVNRNLVEGSDDANSDDQQEPVETQVRKSIPRIIRKTEIIIHDDGYERDMRDRDREKKKSRKGYVRTSSSTDGLMAGLRRGSDNEIPTIRKHTKDSTSQAKEQPSVRKKAEDIKVDIAEDDITGISQRGDRIRRPVDSILSIKKVSSRSDRNKQDTEEVETKKESKPDAVQKTTGIEEEKKAENKAERDKAISENQSDIQKETVSAGAEKTEKRMAAKSQEIQQAKVEKEDGRASSDAGAQQKRTAYVDNKIQQEAPDVPTSKQSGKERDTSEKVEPQDKKEGRTQQTDKSRRSQTQASRPQKDIEAKERTQKTNQQAESQQGREQQNRGFREGRVDRRVDRRDGSRDSGQNRSLGRDAQTNRGPYREGGYSRGKDDRGLDRSRDQGPKGRSDDRGRGVNKPLVIPKVNLAPGQVEEKNNLRGERRSAITRDLEKGFKREAKKEVIKPVVQQSTGRSRSKYKKNFAGHTANVSDMYSDDFVLNEFYEEKDKVKKDRSRRREEKHIPPKAVLKEITIPETITVKNLAEALKKTAAEVIKKLMNLGTMVTLNQELDFDTAAIIGEEFGVEVHKEVVVRDEDILFDDVDDNEEDLVERAPVVVVMGHVDHGKTSLLDAIRKTNVADREAGGITQHIGAYKVNVHGRDITFLDTPGHEAFTAMRARGAQATDIAILVVAADDGVMPQTIEAINHAKAANVSLIVAINKIDKPGANADRVKQELAERGVLIEEWGGDVIAVPVSAKMGTNIDQLLEMVLLTADVLELKANPDRQAKGIVIEAKLDKGRGPVATVLVQRGTLYSGDSIISGTTFGRIRAMTNEYGKRIEQAGPSTPVEIIGLDGVPEAGDVFYAVADEKVARHLVEERKSQQREQSIGTAPKVSLDDLFNQIQQGDVKELNIIVKADVQGSVEAVTQSVERISNEEVKVKVIHGGVGAINEADVTLASVSNAIIIGFNVRPPANVVEAAETAGVDIRLYRIIYSAIEDIEKAMKGLLAPTYKEVIDGHVEIRQTFKASSIGTIGGGYVIDGKIMRNSGVRVVRNGIVAYEGKLASLKRFQDDVREVAQGYECGILIDKFNDIKEGDVIEAFRMVEIERT